MSKSNISDKAIVPLGLIFVVVVVGVIYLSMKAYVYFSTSSKLDAAIKQASPFAEISYAGISSDLLAGSVAVEGVRVLPREINDVINVRELRIAGDGPAFLFGGFSKLGGQPPEALRLDMRGLQIGLDSELMKKYESLAREAVRQQTGSVPGSCDFGGSMAAGDLRALGFDEFSLDLSMQLAFDPRSQIADVTMVMEIVGIEDVSVQASIKVDGSSAAVANAASFSEMNISYSLDPEYIRGVRKYCARITNLSEEQYIDSLVDASDADYLRIYGFVPGLAMRDAVRGFLLSPDSIEIHVKPSQSFKPEMLQLYKFDDLIDMLGLTVKVNQQPLTDLSIKLGDEVGQLFGGHSEPGKSNAQQQDVPEASYAYQDTEIKRLPQYIGAQVKITTVDGKQRTGALTSLNKDTAQLEQRIHSGKFSAFVPLADIQQLQVHRRVKAEP